MSTGKMWSNIDKGQLKRCDQIQIMVKQKDVINTDKGQLGRCDQIQIKVN